MCSVCVALSIRQQTNIRSARRTKNQVKAAQFKTTSPFTMEELKAKKATKSQEFRRIAIQFSTDMKQIIPDRHSYYLHALVWHFPQWIEESDADVMDLSGSGIEMINQETKKVVK